MIHCRYNRLLTTRYLAFSNILLIGPIDGDIDVIHTRSTFDKLDQSKGLYGDNTVFNRQIEADIMIQPALATSDYSPARLFPNRRIFHGSHYYGTPWESEMLWGLATFNSVITGSLDNDDTIPYYYRCGLGGKKESFFLLELRGELSRPLSFVCDLKQFELFEDLPDVIRYHVERKVFSIDLSYGELPGFYPMQISSPFELKSVLDNHLPWSSESYDMDLQAIWVEDPGLSPEKIIGQLVTDLALRAFRPPLWDDEDWGVLAYEAAEKTTRVDTNLLEFALDIKRLIKNPFSFQKFFKDLSSLRGLASDYLEVKYGILPTIQDVRAIVASFKARFSYRDKNNFFEVNSSFRRSAVDDSLMFLVRNDLEQHVKLAYSGTDDKITELAENMDKLGILPDLQNIWDLIPFSFVIDWLVKVSEFLGYFDFYQKALRMRIRYVTMSRKYVTSVEYGDDKFPFTGLAKVVSYHRWVTDQCPLPPLTLQSSSPQGHFLEASALILQRR